MIKGSVGNLSRKIGKLNKKLIELLKQGKKVKAVKALRYEIDMDLIDAKEYIDRLDEI